MAELHFLVEWIDDPLTFDTLPAKSVVPVAGRDILDIPNGMKCAAMFKGMLYNIKIISSGNHA